MNPPHASPNERETACSKVAAYLRACGLPGPEAERLGTEAVAHVFDASAESAVAATLQRFDAHAGGFVAAEAGESPAQRSARGRAQMMLAGLPAREPDSFFFGRPLRDLHAAAAVPLQTTPELRQASMTPQPIDLGPVSEVADGTWRTFDKWPVLRALTFWVLFLLLLGAAFYMVRF